MRFRVPGGINVWGIAAKKTVTSLQTTDKSVDQLTISSDGTILAMVANRRLTIGAYVSVWDFNNGTMIGEKSEA